MPQVASILTVASRGSKLSLDLYNFAANIPSATHDAADLAKAVVDLSRSLWHVGASQKEDTRITTREARETLVDIVQQCEMALNDIEAVVPLEMTKDGKALTYGTKWEWNKVARAKIQYLLGHLESLRLTLDVMAQAIRHVKVIEWSGFQPPNPMSQAAVTMERMHLESLVIEQQLSLLTSGRLFEFLKQRHAESELELIPQDDVMQAMTLFEENASNPSRLVLYQEPTLSSIKSSDETETLALVRRVSSPYIDYLLDRWTRLQEIRRTQQPTVDSDYSSDEENAPSAVHSNGLHSPIGPVLTHIDEEPESMPSTQRNTPSPIPIPDRIRRAYGPASPTSPEIQQPKSWSSRSSSYFPAMPVRPPASAGSSPQTRAGAPFPPSSKAQQTFPPPTRPPAAPSVSSPLAPSSVPGQVPASMKPKILWRLRMGSHCWDFENERATNSNTPLDPSQVQEDRHVSTEIMARFVSEEAIQEQKYRYDRVQVDTGDGRRTKMEPLFLIRKVLTFAEVDALVQRTQQRYEQRYKRSRPIPHFDRSASAPLPAPGAAYLKAPPDPHRGHSKSSGRRHHEEREPRSSVSNDSDTDTDLSAAAASGKRRSRKGSRSSARGSSAGETNSKGRKTALNMRNVAAGAGFAALLEGVAEGLGAI